MNVEQDFDVKMWMEESLHENVLKEVSTKIFIARNLHIRIRVEKNMDDTAE